MLLCNTTVHVHNGRDWQKNEHNNGLIAVVTLNNKQWGGYKVKYEDHNQSKT